jgi:Flp pilus assembly pilin Flp
MSGPCITDSAILRRKNNLKQEDFDMEIEKTVEKVEEKKAERGAGLVEYAILAGIIVGVAVIARTGLSQATSNAFSVVISGTNSAATN